MKTKTLFFIYLILFSSCSAVYTATTSERNQTHININEANFKNLGHFIGVAAIPKKTLSLKARESVISQAKNEMIKQAGEAYQTGKAQIFINVQIEFLENRKNIICTISGDLIEFIN